MAADLLSSRYNYKYLVVPTIWRCPCRTHSSRNISPSRRQTCNMECSRPNASTKRKPNRRADSKHKEVSTKHIITLLFFQNPLAMQPSTSQVPNNNTRIESWQLLPPPRSPPALPVSNLFHPRQQQQQQSSKSRRRRLALHVNMISTKSKRPAASISTISESDPGGSESVLPSITYWKHVHRQDTSEARGQEPGTGAVVNDFVYESGYVMRG